MFLDYNNNLTVTPVYNTNQYNDINRSAAGLMMFILDSFFGVFSYLIVPFPMTKLGQ